jgi:hypothetical protein
MGNFFLLRTLLIIIRLLYGSDPCSRSVSGQTAESLHNYVPPDSLLSKSQGSTHILTNGNALVNWGSAGAVTEYNSKDEPVSGGIENLQAFALLIVTSYPLLFFPFFRSADIPRLFRFGRSRCRYRKLPCFQSRMARTSQRRGSPGRFRR